MKKNLILAAAFLLAAKLATAQTDKGTQNLGLNLSFDHENTNITYSASPVSTNQPGSEKTTALSIGPSYSYFIADKLDIGANFTYSHFTAQDPPYYNPASQHENIYDGELFIRKYFMCSDKFGFRAGPYVGYSKTSSTYLYNMPDTTFVSHSPGHSVYGGISLGMVYYPSKHLGVSATLANAEYAYYKGNSSSANSVTSSNNFSFSAITNNIGVSVFYVFGGK
ncbi:MAG: hypothetical protein ACTHNW_21125 [Mucilaginibacter sp.]